MMDNLNILFEKYKFDYIYINPKDIEKLNFEIIKEELFADFKGEPYWVGEIRLNNNTIDVYYDKKITPGDMIFKYKDIKKERRAKLNNLIN